jgi:hypothetical protein
MKRSVILLVAALLPAGCELVEDPSPEEARLVVEGEAGKQVRIIVSTKFVAAVNDVGQTRIVIFEADTLVTTLPYERRWAIDEDQRFFAEAARLDADLQSVHMEVFIDSRSQFAEGGVLIEAQPYRFVYTFNQQITRDIVVL